MPPPAPQSRRVAKVADHRRIVRCAILLPLPGVVTALALLGSGTQPPAVRFAGSALLLFVTGLAAYALRERSAYSFRTLANVLAALRDGDFSIRLHTAGTRDPLDTLAAEINALGDSLREQRLGALEASALLRTAIEEMDAAIFTFDERHRLRLANRAAERLLARPVEQILGRTALELGLEFALDGEPARIASMTFPGALGRFGFRRSGFRQGGRPHQLLVVTDLSRALREEERQAWQSLLRVLGHELNNSLAPIKSVASSLESLCRREPRPPDWQDDVRDGLALISSRADALSRFMEAYSQLARLPAPRRAPMSVADWVRRVAGLETRVGIRVAHGPDVTLIADRDQLEQLLINLVRNAADAVLESATRPTQIAPPPAPDPATSAPPPSPIEISWRLSTGEIEIRIEDSGPGIANPANLFVPFFTTKPKGSGIGLTLCRQIAEAHDGRLSLENRENGRGCVARLRLPLAAP
ncbi:MAG: PAS domain-containing sensor histidine kinase [Limisphaerales bacterium]